MMHRQHFGQALTLPIDVACVLDYLHNQCEIPIIHCDLKPSNVLQDGDMVAHVGDFGLARFLLGEPPSSNQSSSIGIRGTVGYVAPEYGMGSEASTADVYSYGILLLEMVTGKSPLDPVLLGNDEEDRVGQAAVSNTRHSEKARDNNRIEECFIAMVRIGLACSMESPLERLDINSVIHELHSVKRILQGT